MKVQLYITNEKLSTLTDMMSLTCLGTYRIQLLLSTLYSVVTAFLVLNLTALAHTIKFVFIKIIVMLQATNV